MADIQLQKLEKRWGDVVGVAEFDLHIRDREFLVLLGPSGCGKTTTMRMIAGLESPSAGRILIAGRDVTDSAPRERNIAMVFQSYALYPHKTVRENIRYPLKVRGVPAGEHEALINRAARRVEMSPFLDRKPRELSGGQRQRVALARAIVRQPDVFLMDEPLSNLDAKLRVGMRAELKHLHSELSTTVVYVTHDQIEAMTLGSRVAVMRSGRVMQIDTPQRIYGDPDNLFVAGFVGSPSMNFIQGRIADHRFTAPDTGIALTDDLPSCAAVLGARWEDLQIVAPGEGQISARIYAVEPLGEATQVTLRNGAGTLTVRAPKEFRADVDEAVGVCVDPQRLYFFDQVNEQRLRPARAALGAD